MAPRRSVVSVATRVQRHAWLIIAVSAGFAFSVSNYMTIGDRGYNFEIHYRAWQLFSVFQSSVRFIWPLTVLATVTLVVIAFRLRRVGPALLVVACLLQVFDVWPQLRTVANRSDGRAAPIQFEEALWSAVPEEYEVLAIDPPINIRTGWDECAYAAVSTNREARCGYLSRTIDLQSIADEQSADLLSGRAQQNIVYWLASGWIVDNSDILRQRYGSDSRSFVFPADETVAHGETFTYFFPGCERFENCAFLGDRGVTLGAVIQSVSSRQ